MLIIKNGNIVTSEKTYKSDIKIKDGKIIEIRNNLNDPLAKTIDALDNYILAGAIDSHTHFDLDVGSTKTADDFYTGTRAAIVGGTTTIIDFATQQKGNSLNNALIEWNEKANDKCYCDYSFHMAITDFNENTKNEMKDMVQKGVTSFKMYMAYKNILQVDDYSIYFALKESKKINALIGFHCENGDLISAKTYENLHKGNKTAFYHEKSHTELIETEAINRLMNIASLSDAPVWVVHLSTGTGLDIIKKARLHGVNVVVETCPQYLILDKSRYGEKDSNDFSVAKYVMSPPLREKENNDILWDGLKNNIIDFVSTDHCSFNFNGQKDIGKDDFSKIPNGAPGVEDRFLLMYTYGVCENKITINEMTKLISENPAKLLGLSKKGKIEVGYDADIVILNKNKEDVFSKNTQTQNVDYNSYENMIRKGKIEKVFLRGREVVSDGKIIVSDALGAFIKREPFM